jgi:hypothetical protein
MIYVCGTKTKVACLSPTGAPMVACFCRRDSKERCVTKDETFNNHVCR